MMSSVTNRHERRRVLAAFMTAVVAGMTGALATVLGAFAVPVRHAARGGWLRAAALADLTAGEPFAAIVSVPLDDGWRRSRAAQTVFLIWDGGSGVRALSATCTHLGCRVSWDAGASRFRCPCHGGVYDAQGRVVAGPPPRQLSVLDARIVEGRGEVLVRV